MQHLRWIPEVRSSRGTERSSGCTVGEQQQAHGMGLPGAVKQRRSELLSSLLRFTYWCRTRS